MRGYRITKMVCPGCEGSGKCWLFGTCQLCAGTKRAPIKRALDHANHIYMLAGGGYICGDHSYDDMREMEAKAERVYALAESAPPWKEPRP